MKTVFVDNVLLEQTADGYVIELQPHLGLISLIATLRAAGHAATLFDPKIGLVNGDLRLGPGMYEAAAERVLAGHPDIVGFTSLGSNFVCTLKIARAVRRARPDIPIVLGGPHASIVDRAILERYHEFDLIVRGEAEGTIAHVIAALGGSASFAAIDGLTYREKGAVLRTGDVGPIRDLDALPIAAYDAYPIAELGIDTLDIDAGRGCPFGCSFCSTASFFGRRYRIKSAQRLVDELDFLAMRYGIRSFHMTHDLFTVNKQSVRAFCAAVAGRGYTWKCSARMDCVDADLLGTMREAGCTAIYYGVETGSERLQRVVEKRLDLRLFHPTVRTSVDLGMTTTVSFITGFPAETSEDRDATLTLIGETLDTYSSAAQVQLHLLAPEPGTTLFAEHAAALAYDGHVSDFNFPILDDGDEELIVADPIVFSCHHHFAHADRRAEDISIARAFRLIRRLPEAFRRGLVSRYGQPFAQFVRDVAQTIAGTSDASDALLEFIVRTFGAGDPYADIARYLAACWKLRDEPRQTSPPSAGAQYIRLTHLAVPLGPSLDAARLLWRMARDAAVDAVNLDESNGAHESGTETMTRVPRLLLALPGQPANTSLVAIDECMLRIATALLTPTTRSQLAADFGPAEVERRLWMLDLLGAIVNVPADAPAHDAPVPRRYGSYYLLDGRSIDSGDRSRAPRDLPVMSAGG